MYQCTPVFHLCLCSPDVSFSPSKVSVPLGRVCKAGAGLHEETGVSDMQGRNLWQASPQMNGRGSEDEQDRRWKAITVPLTFSSPPITLTILQLLTGSVNETYHCDTLAECVCGVRMCKCISTRRASVWYFGNVLHVSVHACERLGLLFVDGACAYMYVSICLWVYVCMCVCKDIKQKSPRLISVITGPLKVLCGTWMEWWLIHGQEYVNVYYHHHHIYLLFNATMLITLYCQLARPLT